MATLMAGADKLITTVSDQHPTFLYVDLCKKRRGGGGRGACIIFRFDICIRETIVHPCRS